MEAWGITDAGLVRSENQDAYAIRRLEELDYTIAVVCDGMGGPKGGRLASTLAIDAFLDTCLASLRADMDAAQVQEAARAAVRSANDAVYQRSWDGGLRGMGTTLVSAIAWKGQALVSNVGDSRGYLARPGGPAPCLRRITRDHSYVEGLLERGDITAEEARVHPRRNLITRALGPEPSVRSDCFLVPLEPGDLLLLCSDGLVETATDSQLEQELRGFSGGDACLARLLALAKAAGAPDNVTAVLLRQD